MKDRVVREEGQQLVLMALLLVILLACLGLVADVGNAYVHRRRAQNATDAAASAASLVLYEQGVSTARATALYYAAQHNYNNDGTTNIVTVSSPPTSGAYAGKANYIQVRIQDNVKPIFASIVWPGTFQVVAQAAAGYKVTGKGPAIIVLNQTMCQTLKKTGTSSIHVYNGGIQVNSPCTDALRIVGSGYITSTFPATIVGNFSPNPTNLIIPTPLINKPVLPDPLASLPAPTIPGAYTVQYGTALVPKTKSISSGSVTLNPGIYYGGIDISGSAAVTFSPGEYILAGTGLIVTGSGRITGQNVFFYITNDPSKPTLAGKMGKLDLSGSGNVNLTARNSGTYAGILFFYDRSDTNMATITGSNIWDAMTGVVYIKNAELDLAGSFAHAYASFVIDRLTITGSGSLDTYGYTGAGWQSIDSFLSE